MSYPAGDVAQSSQEEDRERELLCLKIKAQLEDLFTDSHLAQDCFLLKHVQRNKQGYVSLKLLTSLKKIKALTTDWYMTLAAAEYSELLEVNEECTKVRRIEPLPAWLLCSPTSRFLLISNISEEKRGEDGAAGGLDHQSLHERILQKFSACGSVTSVWILHPGQQIPKELQVYAKRHKKLHQHLCAVVKFAQFEGVRRAYSALKAEEEASGAQGMQVISLGHRLTQPLFTREKNSQELPEEENPTEASQDSVQEEPPMRERVPAGDVNTLLPHETKDESMQRKDLLSSSSIGEAFGSLNQRYSRTNLCAGDCERDHYQSPWVLRRKFAAIALNPEAAGKLKQRRFIQRVLRQPYGPDSTKGFLCRRKIM